MVYGVGRFNSIVVRLKVRGLYGEPIRLTSFQFHSGSIKRAKPRFNSLMIYQFQFHSGSIKSRAWRVTASANRRFQFHSGSIKRRSRTGRAFALQQFQFHSGSIKRFIYTKGDGHSDRVSIP